MITGERSTVEVLIADDDPLVRMGLSVMLGGAPDLRIVAEAGDGAEAVELARRHRPDVVLSPAVMRRLIDKVVALPGDGRGQDSGERLAVLNERERAVALGIGQGKSNAEIGAALHLGVSTVKTHVSAILAKLGLNNRVQIALFVHDAGNPEDRYRS
ncbi:response regulator transcription factor [Streptomyces sp. NPDC127110]|uniref:response regulator transcription factor n=1 Tax=Streptomyces sp. NPDC127110 TaxID=3345362 RepID=UPI003641B09A